MAKTPTFLTGSLTTKLFCHHLPLKSTLVVLWKTQQKLKDKDLFQRALLQKMDSRLSAHAFGIQKQAKNKITQIIRQARDEGSHLEITSDIKIHKITAKEHLPRNPETT